MEVNIEDLQKKNPLKNLHEISLEALAVVATTVMYSKGEQLFKAGDRKPMAAFLIQGSVDLQSLDGRIISIDHNYKMAEFALSNLKPRMYTATAASDATVLFWVKDEVLDKMIEESRQSQEITVTDIISANM